MPLMAAKILIGFAVGAATALLLAPQSGEETREWIADQSRRKANQKSQPDFGFHFTLLVYSILIIA